MTSGSKNTLKRTRSNLDLEECPELGPKKPEQPRETPKKNEPVKKPDPPKPTNDPFKFIFLLNGNSDFMNMMGDDMLRPSSPVVQKEIKCVNPTCNHKSVEEDPTPVTKLELTKIESINDLIKLGSTYHCKKNTEQYGINLRLLYNLSVPLLELNQMVGMQSVKKNIVHQILYFLQGFNKNKKCNTCVECKNNKPCSVNKDDMLHTIVSGPPGVGKTELGKILGKLYKEMGILSRGHFTSVTRSDLIGKYLGHTAAKTQEMINKCKGGVMFIDEAYALGEKEGRDSFSKECIDTLNHNLTENRDMLVIIAGYEDSLDSNFFNYNQGLKRRFTFKYNIDKYDEKELMQIFKLKVYNDHWNISKKCTDDQLLELFKVNKGKFPHFGGDIETLYLKCKIAHSNRMLFGNPACRKYLELEDINEGLNELDKHRKNVNKYTSIWNN